MLHTGNCKEDFFPELSNTQRDNMKCAIRENWYLPGYDSKYVKGRIFGKGSSAIGIIPILSINVSPNPLELSNVTPLLRNKCSIKSLKI